MSAVKAIGRRLFSRATMGAPLVLTGIGGAPPPPVMGGGLITATADASNASSLASRIWRAVRSGTRDEGERRERLWTKRSMMGGLDPDLAVMNSMSHQHRVLRQLDRNIAAIDRDKSLRHTIIKAMGGNPEDFE